jgi:menaquinol-cytochrome c reductase iron-sulfur subunit
MSPLLKYPGESSNDALSPEAKVFAHSRRKFLFKLSILLNAAVGTVLAVPLVGYLLGPVIKDSNAGAVGAWIKIGEAEDFPIGETRLADFQSPVTQLGDGETGKVACWVRRVADRHFQVFAVNCAHLGCPVRWFAQARLFMCPCHGGAYYQDGSRAAGPPERGLFEYRTKLDGNALVIHAGNMPTLATQASCKERPLIQIAPAQAATRSTPWQA